MTYRFDPFVAHVRDWISHRGRRLQLSYGQAESFLHALEQGDEPFCFRTYSASPYTRIPGADLLGAEINGRLDECWEELSRLNRAGATVAVRVNQSDCVDADGGARIRALFLDDDSPPGNPYRFGLRPQISIQSSPGKYHFYWLVSGLRAAEFSGYQKSLAARYGGDTRVAYPRQAMSLPGLWQWKRAGQPTMGKILAIDHSPPYSIDQLSALFAESPRMEANASRAAP